MAQLGVGVMPAKGVFSVAQQGNPQSSPWRMGTIFSRPKSGACELSFPSSTAKQRSCPRAQRTAMGLRNPLATGEPPGVPSSARMPP